MGIVIIVETAPLAARPRAADLNIADMTEEAGILRVDLAQTHTTHRRWVLPRRGGRDGTRQTDTVDMGHSERLPDGGLRAPRDLLSRLERTEVTRIGRAMATERGLPFQMAKTGEYVSGKFIGSTQPASGRYAMIESFSRSGHRP